MHTKPSILLLGTGYTLGYLAKLIEDKNSFIVTSRSQQTVRWLNEQGYHGFVVDITDKNSVQSLLQKYPNLNCLVDSVPPPSMIDDYASNLKLLSDHVKYSIYLSTTGVYGRVNGEVVDEKTSLNPSHDRARARIICENIHKETFDNSTILRLPAIYGPGRGVGHAIKTGRYKIIDKGQRITNRIHVEDICSTIQALLEAYLSSKSLPQLLCACDSEPATQIEVVNFYCNHFGFDLPKSVSLEEAKQQLDPTMLSNQKVCNALLKSFLGRELKYPSYRQGAQTEFA